MAELFASVIQTLGGGELIGDWWRPVMGLISVVAGIVGYIYLRKYLKLHSPVKTEYSKQWALEGVVLHRVTLLVLIRDALIHLLGVLYMICTIFVVLNSFGAFVFLTDKASGWLSTTDVLEGFFAQLILLPIAIRLVYEILYLLIFQFGKYIVKFIVWVAKGVWFVICKLAKLVYLVAQSGYRFVKWASTVFIWDAIRCTFSVPVQFFKWLCALLEKQIVRRELETDDLRKAHEAK